MSIKTFAMTALAAAAGFYVYQKFLAKFLP